MSRSAVLGIFCLAFTLAAAGTAGAYHTRFVADNCNYAAPTPTSYITRDGSISVALRARYEGYQWAGGHFRKSPLPRDGALSARLPLEPFYASRGSEDRAEPRRGGTVRGAEPGS